ncbi:MAG: hypothetical protein IJA34_07355 [Lachnospiraceae bacterium]|nr:hypothetical protein [Lachnospiraceae bacterium]
MDKKQAIRIMTRSAQLYKENLEDKKILFLYGVPSEIVKELKEENGKLLNMKKYEVTFQRKNFMHLTGIRISNSEINSSIHFYEKCVANRLKESDFAFSKDGSTVQKLDILENMMKIKKNVTMIGEFTDMGPRLFTEKVAGNICGCIGFVKDRNTNLNVPNTLLKKDIRDVMVKPYQKVYAIFSKDYLDEKYTVIEKMDKSIDINKIFFCDEIENAINCR